MTIKTLITFFNLFLLLPFINAQEGAMPPDFKCSDCTLVIIKPEKKSTIGGYEKNMRNNFKKYYSQKFEIVTAKELESDPRFQDKKVYRFVLNYKLRGDIGLKQPGSAEQVEVRFLRFCLHDRQLDKDYPCFAETTNSIPRTAKILGAAYK